MRGDVAPSAHFRRSSARDDGLPVFFLLAKRKRRTWCTVGWRFYKEGEQRPCTKRRIRNLFFE